MDAAFDHAQAVWDAAEPNEGWGPADPIGTILEDLLTLMDGGRSTLPDETGEVHTLSDRQATATIWIDGHEYSLTLNREVWEMDQGEAYLWKQRAQVGADKIKDLERLLSR